MLSWSGAGARRPPPADSTRPSGISIDTEWYIRGRAGEASCFQVLVVGLHCSAVRVPLGLKSFTSVDPPITIASPVGSMVTLWKERAVAMSGTVPHTGVPLVMSSVLAFRTEGTGLLGVVAVERRRAARDQELARGVRRPRPERDLGRAEVVPRVGALGRRS